MISIIPKEDYKIEDLSKEKNIHFLLPLVNILDNNDVVIDLRHCYIDYPTTGKLFDKVLQQLAINRGKKTLTIIYDYHLHEYDLLACLFDECSFFDSRNFKELSYDQVLELIRTKIEEKGIFIKIILYKLFSQETKMLTYGVE